MAKISTYTIIVDPSPSDKLIGTDVASFESFTNETKNFLISSILQLLPSIQLTLPTYSSNAAATSGGLAVGQLYKNSSGAVFIVY